VIRFIIILALSLLPIAASAQQLPPGHPPPQQPPPQQAQPDPPPEQAQQAQQLPPGHPTPVGPTTAMGQIAEQQEAADQEAREERAQPGVPNDHMRQALAGETPEISSALPSREVPVGAVRVMVVDGNGDPVPGVDVELALMQQDGERDRNRQATDETGLTVFSGLATGQGQAYRVNVYTDGAKISSTPFQLPTDQGYHVSIIKLPTRKRPARRRSITARRSRNWRPRTSFRATSCSRISV